MHPELPDRLRRGLPLALSALLLLPATACRRHPEPEVVDGKAYGVTDSAFRHRWWLYYERGLSWAEGGFLTRAEADLRTCLRLRQTDRRRARTYGMHFVQAFPHRELGAVLLAQGRLDEAESELRESLRQEPSAKAAALLERLAEQRGEAPAPDDPAAAAVVRPAPTATALTVHQVERADDELALSGRVESLLGQGLYILRRGGELVAVATDAAGGFIARMAPGERLARGPTATTDPAAVTPLVTAAEPPPRPELEIDLPAEGAVLFLPRLLLRYEARSATPLARIVVRSGDETLAAEALGGVLCAGMLELRLPEGEQTLRVELVPEAGDAVVRERRIEVRPTPEHRPELRASAMLLPLQAPETGEPPGPADDPRLLSALSADGRFQLIDRQADELLERELRLVDAGYVDRVTAASAGRRLQARYVVAGTLRRNRGEIECFLRLVNTETGYVVATADAWIERGQAGEERPFFELAAARLRQVFPVVAATVVPRGDDLVLDLGREAGIAERMRFHLIRTEPDLLDPATGAVLMPGRQQAVGTVAVEDAARGYSAIETVDGEAPAAGAKVVSE